ncbi:MULTISPECIES: glycine--tRNA ligase subunit beta [unclassified Granulicatella]|uniref:glycine--tRNA ligase subunit beta n=1 Tax=unclassified Granulicatella TaxID=2630493 RepID=UPI001072F87F|nr:MULTISPECIES: glycine--tRNA ligase subunit beta [unclassified Granulicatella]MBF0780802.1 glycine--tRNA ligase subunit beta [Granulicatella sp. 19428wC4_WM01]TFU93818.1 glycine--tRNA ligase subunit beta [Granulicatella sp. WM01]
MGKDLLLEIGLEEIPAKYVRSSSNQLKERVSQFLRDNRISFEDVFAYSTPRRLAVHVKQVSDTQEEQIEIFKGPSKKIALDEQGNWTKAIEGFVRGKGLSLEDVYWETIKGEEYAHVKKHNVGQTTKSILPQLKQVILEMTFPVSMTWSNHSLQYIRPIHWIVALYAKDVIPFDILNVTTGRLSKGHRFLGQDVLINAPEDYVSALEQEHVLVDQDVRKKLIVSQIQALAKENQWIVDIDEELLEEVVSIVEYPTAFFGQFDEKYLVVPDEVLVTTMKEHQRYFYVKDSTHKLLPYFISVRNGNSQFIDNVIKGNEKVLVARLEDALFFTKEDEKLTIEELVAKLNHVNFHVNIGSIADKMANVGKIVNILGEVLNEDVSQAYQASEIYKFDLVTNMVGEFPELQGIIGEKYALKKGINADIARAIKEHYMPLSSTSELPNSLTGSILALADKIDTLISFFKINVIPSGSNDPYALRRTAIGIVRLLEANQWAFDIDELFSLLLNDVYQVPYDEQQEILTHLHTFMDARVRQLLQSENIRHDLIQAVLEIDVFSIPFIMENARELQLHAKDNTFKETIEALSRVINLYDKSLDMAFEIKDFDEKLAQTNSELALNQALDTIECVEYQTFATLAPLINAFFAENMVFVDDELIRNNRLCLISDCAELILYYMDPTKIVR